MARLVAVATTAGSTSRVKFFKQMGMGHVAFGITIFLPLLLDYRGILRVQKSHWNLTKAKIAGLIAPF